MRKESSYTLVTILVISGIFVSYILQMAPSPILTILRDEFQLYGRDSWLNLSVSIICPVLIIFSMAGGMVTKKLGLKGLYIIALAFMSGGTILNYIVGTYVGFLVGRLIFGIGFGLGIPFIGSIIMNCYQGKKQDTMNTVNAILPFVGTLISFGLLVPLYQLFNNSWRTALGIWGFFLLIIMLIWICFVDADSMAVPKAQTEKEPRGNIYWNLLKQREIRLLCAIFSCDYFCYSYIAVILPTFLQEQGNMTEQNAGILAAIAFPVFGLIGCATGGGLNGYIGHYKPSLVYGQILKLVGVFIAVFGSSTSVWLSAVGFAAFGFGNGFWMPAMYCIPMKIDGMTAECAGAAFALISSFGFAFGFVSPTVGGWLTEGFTATASYLDTVAQHAFGLRMSLLVFSVSNFIALLCAIKLKEKELNNEEIA